MMEFSTAEKIYIILKRQNMTMAQLAELTGQSRQNLANKLNRDNFCEKELKLLAEHMGVKYESHFIFENGEKL